MKKNNFFKYGKIFLSSVLVSIYSSVGIVSYRGNFQDIPTTMSLSVKNDVKSFENKIKSINSNKDSIKNNLKINSRSAVTMNSLDKEKKSGFVSTHIKKIKSFPQKILKVAKYLASYVVCGIGYVLKNNIFQNKPPKKYAEIDLPPKDENPSAPSDGTPAYGNHSAFVNYNSDDDDDDPRPSKFFSTKPTDPDTSTFTKDEETPTTVAALENENITNEDPAPPIEK